MVGFTECKENDNTFDLFSMRYLHSNLVDVFSYVVGTILPPLLPTVFTVSVGVSNDRLAKKGVATANSESILIAGKVTRAFFDKTGK